jgi:hypothetical protein
MQELQGNLDAKIAEYTRRYNRDMELAEHLRKADDYVAHQEYQVCCFLWRDVITFPRFLMRLLAITDDPHRTVSQKSWSSSTKDKRTVLAFSIHCMTKIFLLM